MNQYKKLIFSIEIERKCRIAESNIVVEKIFMAIYYTIFIICNEKLCNSVVVSHKVIVMRNSTPKWA